MREINKNILHCDASSNPEQDSIEAVRHLHTSPKTTPIKWGTYNTHGKGWSDVGYHFYINSKGVLEYGRPLSKVGAHCLGENEDSIGICLSGGKIEDFNSAQFATLYKLLRSLAMIFPGITTHGHNEFANKACPIYSVTPFKTV